MVTHLATTQLLNMASMTAFMAPSRMGAETQQYWHSNLGRSAERVDCKEWAIATAYVMSYHIDDLSTLGIGNYSELSGPMLRMYLDGKADPEVIAKIGPEIEKHDLFKKFRTEIEKQVFKQARESGRLLTPLEIAEIARGYIEWYNAEHRGIRFRGPLTAVVGGVGIIEPDSEATVKHLWETNTHLLQAYSLQITIADEYDFDNERSGDYEEFRNELVRLLDEEEYAIFELLYNQQMRSGVSKSLLEKLGFEFALDGLHVFAAFMYAIEQANFTPGPMPWSVTVTMVGSGGLHKRLPDSTATASHKYKTLLQKVKVEDDWRTYGGFHDFGWWSQSSYGGQAVRPGYWVYVYPHWYIWGEKTS